MSLYNEQINGGKLRKLSPESYGRHWGHKKSSRTCNKWCPAHRCKLCPFIWDSLANLWGLSFWYSPVLERWNRHSSLWRKSEAVHTCNFWNPRRETREGFWNNWLNMAEALPVTSWDVVWNYISQFYENQVLVDLPDYLYNIYIYSYYDSKVKCVNM